ncbi:MAG: hypothetical protein K2X27_05380 [Candidatus Obscuribacterales bacterium]|nr:hypothetical protein [Candidatus Obscuribacterales bacterium]
MSLTLLDEMLSKMDAELCLEFFAGMPEKERKTYAQRVLEWYELAEAFEFDGSAFMKSMRAFPDALNKKQKEQLALVVNFKQGKISIPKQASDPRSLPCSRLAACACASLTDLRKLPLPAAEYAFRAMIDRKPKWLDKWLDYACQRDSRAVWHQVRAVELSNLAQAERGDNYWVSMLLTLGQAPADELLKKLEEDPEIADKLLWQMLENEAAVRLFCNPAGINEQLNFRSRNTADWQDWAPRLEAARRASYIWQIVILDLANKNENAKKRLIDISLSWLLRLAADTESRSGSGLSGELSPANYFQSLLDSLNLDRDEKTALADRFIGLLTVKDSSTLAWTLQRLQECELASLAYSDLLANLPRVFYQKRKEAAQAAIKLLELCMEESISSPENLAEVCLESFEHPSPDIHKRALSFLKKYKLLANAEVLSALENKSERVSVLIKKEISDLLEKAAPAQSSRKSAFAKSEQSKNETLSDGKEQEKLESLVREAESLHDDFWTILNLSSFRDKPDLSLDDSILSSSIDLSSNLIPRLSPSKRIEAISKLDDLIYLLLHVLEDSATADDVERALDGISRLCDQRPDDFESRVSSLRKKLQPTVDLIQNHPLSFSPFNGSSARMDIHALLLAWLNAKIKKAEAGGILRSLIDKLTINANSVVPTFLESAFNRIQNSAPPILFFSERLKALSRQVSKGISQVLLSAPTHAGGWIDPLVLAERLKALEKSQTKPETVDLIQALLRLAPENRIDALEQLPKSQNEYWRVLSFALGGQMQAPLNTAELWVAAFRCREPNGQSKILQERFPELGPDSAVRASYLDNFDEFKKRSSSIYGNMFQNKGDQLPFVSVPALKFRNQIRFFPCELLHDRNIFWEGNDYLESYWLQDRESYFAYLARRMAVYLDSQGSYWKSSWDCVFDPDTDLSGMGSYLLIFGLSAKQSEAARLALDSAICAIEEERLDAASFGAKMAKVYESDSITLSRWLSAFKEINRISILHSQFLKTALETCIASFSLEIAFKAPIPIMEMLYEACLSTESATSNDKARRFFSAVKGKGKAAKLAALLLAFKPSESKRTVILKQIAIQKLESRIARGRRWQNCRAAALNAGT